MLISELYIKDLPSLIMLSLRFVLQENILLDGQDKPRITDFGLSYVRKTYAHTPQASDSPPGLGTLRFQSPELIYPNGFCAADYPVTCCDRVTCDADQECCGTGCMPGNARCCANEQWCEAGNICVLVFVFMLLDFIPLD